MTLDQQLDIHLGRHNEASSAKALAAASMALIAWVFCPALFLAATYPVFRMFSPQDQAIWKTGLAGTVMAVSAYGGANALLACLLVIRKSEHSYASLGFWKTVLWPGAMTGECINQYRQILRLSQGDRAAAKSILLKLHLAGADGVDFETGAGENTLIRKLEEIGALRAGMPRVDGIRLYRREPCSEEALATTLDPLEQPPIGLIAGGGDLPLLQANGLHAAGRRVIGIGLRGQYDPSFPSFCDEFMEASPLRPNSWVRHLRAKGAFEAVMVGHIQKTRMYNPRYVFAQLPDATALHIWFVRKRHDRRSQGLLGTLADALKEKGLLLLSTTAFIPDQLATRGTMTSRCGPTENQKKDIHLAVPLLIQLNMLDIGQGLCVKDGDVIAVEAMEGTDRMIARAGELCPRGGWTLVKGANGPKDPRFDVPTVGVGTIETLKKAGASCLALVAGRTIMLNKPEVLKAADKAGIAVFGFEME